MSFTAFLVLVAILQEASSHGDHPFSRIAVHRAALALTDLAYIKAYPSILGLSTVSFTLYTEQDSLWIV